MTVEACPTCANVGGHYPGCPSDPDRTVPPRDYAHNGSAAAARRLKAAFLMDQLKADGLTPEQARRLRHKERRAVERAAGTRRGSDETWELAATLLEEDLAYRAGLTNNEPEDT